MGEPDQDLPPERNADATARDERDAAAISRGVMRLLRQSGLACLAEMSLPNGRRVDVMGLTGDGRLWAIEIKSSRTDFLTDRKWPEYRGFADAFFFAVAPGFPLDILPADEGLILADRWHGEIMREPIDRPLAPARRKALILRFARTAAMRLHADIDAGPLRPPVG